jgi:hypothetical protein
MFGILSVERPGAPGTLVRNTAHGTGNVASRQELFDDLKKALGPDWQGDSVIVKFFYAEPDEV